METERTQVLYQMLYLIVCGLNKYSVNRKLLAGMDLEAVYKVSKFHALAAITYMAIENSDVKDIVFNEAQRKVLKKWKEAKNKARRKNILLDIERGRLEAYLTEHEIWYLPLKGILLQGLYPAQGMRQMADNDILFDSRYQNKVYDYFVSQGYEVKAYGKGNHDVYLKAPVMNFEMHLRLYSELHKEGWAEYYANVYERLLPNDENKYCMSFSNEDFYVYFVSHAYKHHNGSGTGIRTLLDTWVYLKRYELELNFTYIREQLALLGVADYEEVLRSTAQKVFAKKDTEISLEQSKSMEMFFEMELNTEERKLLQEMLGAGTYGTISNRIQKKLKEISPEEDEISIETKLRYYAKRFCPDDKFFKVNYPFIDKHRWLKPVFLVWRATRGVVSQPKRICSEIIMVWKKK